MLRILVVILSCLGFAGCSVIAQMQAKRAAQQQVIRDRLGGLSPEQRAAVEQCSSLTIGRMNTLRLAQQVEAEQGESAASRMNEQANQRAINSLVGSDGTDYAVISDCLDNPHYYETIPTSPPMASPTAPHAAAPAGGMSSWQQCMEAQAAGAAAC